MSSGATPTLSWTAAQRWRLRVLRRDGRAFVRGIARTVAWALAARPQVPGLAVLEGEPIARKGVPSAYRLRVHNPDSATRSVRLAVRGWSEDDGALDFDLSCDLQLAPGASVERWVRSTWAHDGALLATAPADAATVWACEEDLDHAHARWVVEAELAEGDATRDRLRIGGMLLR